MDQDVFSFFRTGTRYSPTHSFKRLGSSFSVGEVLTFKRATFGPYDEVYFYEFTPSDGGPTKSWFPLRDEEEKDCARYFVAIA
jgi:hypothetical protein